MVKHYVKVKKESKSFEKFVLAVAIAEPLSTLPQISEVFMKKNAESVSLLSWLLFTVASVIWLIYGVKIKNVPLIVSSILWVVTEVTLVVGIILY